jgi:dienelactone hydrolase
MAAMGVRKSRSRATSATIGAALLAFGCAPAPETQTHGGATAAEVVRLWPGAAPGTESWTGSEVELDAELPMGKVHVVTNVTVPTLTVVGPAARKANGTAMLVLPGGAFRALAWDLDGTETARWLADRGITAFILKYRVRPPGDQAPSGPESFDAYMRRTAPARDIAVADAQQALRLIRANSAKYGLRKDRIGMIGFSAGAQATMALILANDASARPDFAASLYGAMPPDQVPPPAAPPLFIAAAQDDPQVPPAKSTEIFERWSRAGRPAELHLYEQGGHGFGFRPGHRPADSWPAAFEAWLRSHGLLAAIAGR